jgi:hypothetical protein
MPVLCWDERFEQACLRRGVTVIRVAATLYAVPFYLKMGYKRSTGVRSGWSFEGRGLQIQPMKKILESDRTLVPTVISEDKREKNCEKETAS